jgi:hypothetical protein
LPEKWDCLFVNRINSVSRRIYLEKPPDYGFMYLSKDGTINEKKKVRNSIMRECGQIKGSSNENKILIATALAIAFNRKRLKTSDGLIIRGFKGRTPFPGLQTSLIITKGQSLRIKGSTGWLVYVSPEEKFYTVTGKYLGNELTTQQHVKICSCIQSILSW